MKTNKENYIIEKLETILKRLEENETLMTFDDACKYLCVSESTLYKLTSQGKIGHYKPNGKMIYFSMHQLNSWIKSRKPIKKCSIKKVKLSDK